MDGYTKIANDASFWKHGLLCEEPEINVIICLLNNWVFVIIIDRNRCEKLNIKQLEFFLFYYKSIKIW